MCQHVFVGWKEAMEWGWVRQAIRLPLWPLVQHFTLETKHHPLLWFEGWKFWLLVFTILIKPGNYDLDRKRERPWYFWPFTLGNTVAQSHPHGNLPPFSSPLHHLGSTGVKGDWYPKSWRTIPHSDAKGHTDPLQVWAESCSHTCFLTPPVAQRRHLKAHYFLEVWPLPADDTCFIFLISSSAYQPQVSLPYIFISSFIS